MAEEPKRGGTLTVLQGRVTPSVVKRLLGANFIVKPPQSYAGDLLVAQKQKLMEPTEVPEESKDE